LDSRTNKLTFSNPFSTSTGYAGNVPLFISFSSIKNPISVTNLGEFTITTYTRISNTYYEVDSSSQDNLVTTKAGLVYKGADVTASNLVTYYAGVEGIYNFNFNFEHDIPLGGYIRINLPDEMDIAYWALMNSYCYRLEYSSSPINLPCKMVEPNAFEV